MKICIIAAVDINGVIAIDGEIPWECPDDMAFFRRETIGGGNNAVIIGRKTFETLTGPLVERHTIVVSEQLFKSGAASGFDTATSLGGAIACAKYANRETVFIAGGHNLYMKAMDFADELILTIMDVEVCDLFAEYTYFPGFTSLVLRCHELSSESKQVEVFPDRSVFRIDLSAYRETYDDLAELIF